VSVARIVDICGRDATVPAFEAESVELSGRGIRVKTSYLPPPGAPLVCRIDDAGREIVVEGVVAWQNERDNGGEFGIRFTALDSQSVEVLKDLCGAGDEEPAEASAQPATEPSEEAPAVGEAGSPVKLHIDGLGAPMKARVRTGTPRKLQVGSNLEFLKVGRGLEVEDVAHGERRGARIDAVSIALDPETQVPQLVVVLRYEGADSTPEPSVVDDEDDSRIGAAVLSPAARAAVASMPVHADEPENMLADEDDSENDAAAAAMRSKADAFAVSVGDAMQKGGKALGRFGISAATSFAGMLRSGSEKARHLVRRDGGEKRRSTAPSPSVAPTTRRLRPQNGAVASEQPSTKRRKIIAGAGAAAALTLAVAGIAAMGTSKKNAAPASGAEAQPAATDVANGQGATATSQPMANAAMPTNQPAFGAQGADVSGAPGTVGATPNGAMPSTGAGNAAMPRSGNGTMPNANGAPGAVANAAVPGQRGAVANVPLFGPTPMATLEPAPLGPGPDEIDVPPAQAGKPTQARDDEFSDADRDESFTESSSKKHEKGDKSDKGEKSEKAEIQPEDVKPFIEGKLHLPVIHKLKLDKPGTALQGTKQGNGFTVVIPNRKVTDSGTAIVKRDDRIADVKIKNTDAGARITFVFRSKVPAYKVRLRHSSIEFFVSSPDGAK
jgi:hypothetical protein